MKDLLSLLPDEVDELVVRYGAPRYRADQILREIYHGRASTIAEIRQLPATLRNTLDREGWRVARSRELARVESTDGLTLKLLLGFDRAPEVETVLMRYRRDGGIARASVCVSTQAGCAMGCTFCATGQMGFARNLGAAEIVSQVLQLARLQRQAGERITHVTFMGMGEPLANYAATLRAVRLLTHSRAFGLAQRSLTLSTVGLVPAIDRLAGEGLQVNLAISLHTADDELRRKLVATARPGSVDALVAAAGRYRAKTGRRVTFQYALIEGVNDSERQASDLAMKLRGSDAHVNLIPVNPTAGPFRRPPRHRVRAFQAALQAGGVNATVRSEKGAEIAAACGQLRTALQPELGKQIRERASRPLAGR